jgi:FkbM family methyltransferase
MSVVDRLVPPATTYWADTRLARLVAWHLGELLARDARVLTGHVPTGSPIALSSRDHQHRAIYFYGAYEPGVTALLRRRLRVGDTFFDVGANAGYFALIAGDLGATVRAFEPNPRVRALLERSAAGSHGRIVVEAIAASDRKGTARLNLGADTNSGQASLDIDRPEGVVVSIQPLDEYCEETGVWPTVMKVDVERHEDAVLRGARRILRERRPLLIVETASDETVELLGESGYRPFLIGARGNLQLPIHRLDYGGEYLNLAFRAV